MHKDMRTLLGLAAAVAVLAGGWTALRARNEALAAAKAAAADTGFAVFNAEEAVRLHYAWAGGETELFKNEEGVWRLEQEPEAALDATPVESMLSAVCVLEPQTTLTGVQEPELYGLAEPAVTAEVTLADGSTHTYRFGLINAVTGSVYLTLDGEASTVYVVSGGQRRAFEKSPADLKPPLTPDTAAEVAQDSAGD